MRALSKKMYLLLLLALMAGGFAVPANSQNWQRLNRLPNRGYNTVRTQRNSNTRTNTQNNNTRASVSYSTQPTTENSFYPTIRQNFPEATYSNQNNYQTGWSELGNGAVIRQSYSQQNSNSQSENKLSPEVLETIRQLKAEYAEPEPRYQMAPNTASTNTASTSSASAPP